MQGESSWRALIALVYTIAIGAQEARAANCADIEPDPATMALQTPVTGSTAQLGAGFGMRKHPILDRTRLHAGIDWTAPLGTPVVAAIHGRVTAAGGVMPIWVRTASSDAWSLTVTSKAGRSAGSASVKTSAIRARAMSPET